jgi:hypothetical protein
MVTTAARSGENEMNTTTESEKNASGPEALHAKTKGTPVTKAKAAKKARAKKPASEPKMVQSPSPSQLTERLSTCGICEAAPDRCRAAVLWSAWKAHFKGAGELFPVYLACGWPNFGVPASPKADPRDGC